MKSKTLGLLHKKSLLPSHKPYLFCKNLKKSKNKFLKEFFLIEMKKPFSCT